MLGTRVIQRVFEPSELIFALKQCLRDDKAVLEAFIDGRYHLIASFWLEILNWCGWVLTAAWLESRPFLDLS